MVSATAKTNPIEYSRPRRRYSFLIKVGLRSKRTAPAALPVFLYSLLKYVHAAIRTVPISPTETHAENV